MEEDRRHGWWVVAAIAFVVLVVVGLWLHGRARDRAALEAALAELRRKGEPVTPADLRPSGEGMGENAAEAYQDAFWQMADLTDDDRQLLTRFAGGRTDKLSEEELSDVEKLVRGHGEALRALEEGTELAWCYFESNWEDAIGAVLPHLGDSRALLSLLLARARLAAIEGENKAAAGDIRTALRFCEHQHGQPTLIAALVAFVMEAYTMESLHEVCAEATSSPEELASLEEELARLQGIDTFGYTLATERVLMLETLHLIRERKIPVFQLTGNGGNRAQEELLRLRTNFAREGLACVEHFERLEALAGRPYHEIAWELESLDTEMTRSLKEDGLVLYGMLMPAGTRGLLKERAKREARLVIARVGIAALAHLSEKGEWPQEAPLKLTDPFDGKTLKYRADGDEPAIWSVGEDQTDDSGDEVDSRTGKGDIVWRLKRPGAASRPAGKAEAEEDP